MQYDPSKQGYNNYGNPGNNQYPPMNQPQFGPGNVYPPNNAPPPYAQYPQQPGMYPTPPIIQIGQTQSSSQQQVVAAPAYVGWNHLIAIPITPNLRTFLIVSGILYLIWATLAIGLEIGIIVNSYSTYYRGIWGGGFLIGGGIAMLIASCRTTYVMAYLLRMYAMSLCFCTVALILSVVNLIASSDCSIYIYFCDDPLATHLKIVILAVFIIATIHSLINITIAKRAQNEAILFSASGVQTQR